MVEQNSRMSAAKWLQLIEDESLRNKAIDYVLTCPGHPYMVCSNISEALFHAFSWEKTKEGEFYWLDVYKSGIRLKQPQVSAGRTKRLDLVIAAGVTFTVGIASFWMF